MQQPTNDYRLVTLDIAIAPYAGVSIGTARRWIKAGKLPAAKAGRSYLVDPRDVAALLRPVVRGAPEKPEPETPRQRAERQLARAGLR